MSLADNLERVQESVAAAAQKAGRPATDVTLMAVSKTWPIPTVQEVVDAGQIDFGENRIQEAETKVPAMASNLRWHLIGHLQSNKVRKALPLFDQIHSLDSLDLAKRVNHIATDLGIFPKVYLQVNIADDSAKYGFSEAALEAALEEILGLDRLEILGLMTIPAFNPDPEATRPAFAALREFRDRLQSESAVGLPALSMGMSHDYPVAIEEGATIVRVGSAIFGKRR